MKRFITILKKNSKARIDDETELYWTQRLRAGHDLSIMDVLQPVLYEDEDSSIITFSTNSTVDDNPGTGRIIDKFIYQIPGRALERLALRLTISSLSPERILGYFASQTATAQHCAIFMWHFEPHTFYPWSLECMSSTMISGIKGLAKQSQ